MNPPAFLDVLRVPLKFRKLSSKLACVILSGFRHKMLATCQQSELVSSTHDAGHRPTLSDLFTKFSKVLQMSSN